MTKAEEGWRAGPGFLFRHSLVIGGSLIIGPRQSLPVFSNRLPSDPPRPLQLAGPTRPVVSRNGDIRTSHLACPVGLTGLFRRLSLHGRSATTRVTVRASARSGARGFRTTFPSRPSRTPAPTSTVIDTGKRIPNGSHP